jgi:hypothetical protein
MAVWEIFFFKMWQFNKKKIVFSSVDGSHVKNTNRNNSTMIHQILVSSILSCKHDRTKGKAIYARVLDFQK